MSAEGGGIFVPYRVIFITVIVSICINIFFLLMGILIGKDDLAWGEQQGREPASQVETRLRDNRGKEPDETRDRIERELAAFNEQDESQDADIRPLEERLPVAESVTESETRTEPQSQVNLGQRETSEAAKRAAADPPQKSQTTRPATKEPVKTPVAGGESFWIQLSATGDKSKAGAFRDMVKKSGYSAVVLEEGGMYKIQVGPYANRQDAEADRKKINETFKINAWIRAR